jgi:hypothetical protein
LFVIAVGNCFGPPPPGETVLQNGDSTAKGVLNYQLTQKIYNFAQSHRVVVSTPFSNSGNLRFKWGPQMAILTEVVDFRRLSAQIMRLIPYTESKISAILSYVTVRGEGKIERVRGEQDGKVSV